MVGQTYRLFFIIKFQHYMHCGDHVVRSHCPAFYNEYFLREGGVVGYICIEAPARDLKRSLPCSLSLGHYPCYN